jgi:hypothetical protein
MIAGAERHPKTVLFGKDSYEAAPFVDHRPTGNPILQ